MEKLDYLKDHVQTNIPAIVTIHKRVGQYPETDFNTKQPTGRMQTLYNFQLSNGRMVRHYAKEREEEVLRMFQAGESVQVVRQESTNDKGQRFTFLVWTPTEGAEARAAANPQPMSNTRQTATERELKDRDEKQETREIQISLAGLMQAFIIQGKNTDDALKAAEDARTKLIKRATEIRVGIGPMTHSPQQIADVNAAFGEDHSAPLPDQETVGDA